jgi:hypothetical protein
MFRTRLTHGSNCETGWSAVDRRNAAQSYAIENGMGHSEERGAEASCSG